MLRLLRPNFLIAGATPLGADYYWDISSKTAKVEVIACNGRPFLQTLLNFPLLLRAPCHLYGGVDLVPRLAPSYLPP